MKHQITTTTTAVIVAAALAISACGSSNDADPLEAGRIELEGNGSNDNETGGNSDDPDGATAGGDNDSVGIDDLSTDRTFPDGAPDYCTTLAVLQDATGLSNQQQFEIFVQLLDGLAADGPEDLRDDMADIADDHRAVAELGIDTLDIAPDAMTIEVRDAVIDLGVATEQFAALTPQLIERVRQDCGDDLVGYLGGTVEQSDGDAQPTATPTGDDDDDRDADLFGDVFDQPIEGAFGTGTFNSTTFTITDFVWTNRSTLNYFESNPEIPRSDLEERRAFITLELVNNDPTDRVLVQAKHLTLLVGDREFPARQASNDGTAGRYIDPMSSFVMILAFEVGEVIPVDEMTLRFSDERIPGYIDVIDNGNSDDSPYPLAIDTPEAGEYIGGFDSDCDVIYTWTVDTASVLIDLPADYDSVGGNVNGRAARDTRWLRFRGNVSSGQGADGCTSTTGTVNGDSLRFLIDGRPVEPLNTPLAVLGEVEQVELDLFAEIPIDAVEVGIKALGRGDSTFESTITLPELPSVRGE